MKTFKLIGSLLLALTLGTQFTACSHDDLQQNDLPPAIKTGRKVLNIHTTNEGTNHFTYDQYGNLTRVTVSNGEHSYEYHYLWNGNTIKITRKEPNGATQDYGMLSLSNNFITAFTSSEQSILLNYNYEGQISRIKEEYFHDTRSSNTTVNYSWQGGNLVHTQSSTLYSNGTQSTIETDISYDRYKHANSLCYLYEEYITDRIFSQDAIDFLLAANPRLIGVGNRAAITQIHVQEDGISKTFTYEYNADEFPTTIVEKEGSTQKQYDIVWEEEEKEEKK